MHKIYKFRMKNMKILKGIKMKFGKMIIVYSFTAIVDDFKKSIMSIKSRLII